MTGQKCEHVPISIRQKLVIVIGSNNLKIYYSICKLLPKTSIYTVSPGFSLSRFLPDGSYVDLTTDVNGNASIDLPEDSTYTIQQISTKTPEYILE